MRKRPTAREPRSPTSRLTTKEYYSAGALLLLGGLVVSFAIRQLSWDKALYILSFGAASTVSCRLWPHGRCAAGRRRGLAELVYDLNNMPGAMRQLALAQVFTWFALFAFFIYSTAAVTSYHFGSSDPRSEAYNAGANWVGVLMSVYNGVAALVAFLLPVMAKRTSRVTTHVVCLVIGGIGLCSMHLFKQPGLLDRLHGGPGHRLGQPADDAVCDPQQRRALSKDGSLHGHVQFLHRHPANPRRRPAGPAGPHRVPRACHRCDRYGRDLHDRRRGAHATGQGRTGRRL